MRETEMIVGQFEDNMFMKGFDRERVEHEKQSQAKRPN